MSVALRAVVRALPMTSRIIPGQPQALATTKIVNGGYEACGPLDQAADDLCARAADRDEARDAMELLAAVVRQHLLAKVEQRFGTPAPLSFHEASEKEQVADNAVDLLQVIAGPVPTPSVLIRLRTAIPRHLQTLDDLLTATHRCLQRVEGTSRGTW